MAFTLENRYVVFKLSKLSEAQHRALVDVSRNENIVTVDGLVIEKDWPEYEVVRDMIEHRVEHNEGVAEIKYEKENWKYRDTFNRTHEQAEELDRKRDE